MFLPFFESLRRTGVPVSLREYLAFLEGVAAGLVTHDALGFYHLARSAMVKDERHLDRFDRAFAESFRGLETITPETVLAALDLPRDWLERWGERHFSAEERAQIAALGGFEALMETFRARLAEQKDRHEGGNRWIGTGGTSPFGAYGYNPEGVRIGQDEGRQGRAVKVWDKRQFRDLDDGAELGTRAVKVALRRLRRWARDGAAEEFDLDGTVHATARQGWLDLRMRRPRRNAAKVLLFLDVGGSMEAHVQAVEDLFSAARAEFASLTHFYFHNCLYEHLWQDNRRRWEVRVPTWDVLRRHGAEYHAIFVGDAAMSPYELTHAGGATEHWNPEPGQLWLERACAHWPKSLWINPTPEAWWDHTQSTRMIRDILGGRMVPLTTEGLSRGMKVLT
jgi:uncharacterized protein with von Willebrand factor type A (vWA) domain